MLNVESLEGRWVPSVVHVGSHPGEYSTIQQAIDNATPGETIMVDPGTYQEQINVSTNSSGVALNNLTLESAKGAQNTIIKLPSTAPVSQSTAVVEVTGAKNVTIEGFTISGPGNGAGSIGYGIEIDGGGSARIVSNHVTQIEDSPVSGDQNGIGIEVGRFATGQTGSATILNNVIDNYQKNGIVVSNAGSSATIQNNVVIGLGPTSLIAQNGIEVAFGANAQVIGNHVTNNLYVPTTTVSTGILLYEPGVVTASGNVVNHNDVGVYSYDATGAKVTSNVVTYNVNDGIVLDTTSLSHVQNNVVNRNGSSHYDVADENVDGGIVLYGSSHNVVTNNAARNNSGVGVFVDAGSTGNTFSGNVLLTNALFNVDDVSAGTGTAGTANAWHANTHGPNDRWNQLNG